MASSFSWESFIKIHGGEASARDVFEKAVYELLRAENPGEVVRAVKVAQADGGIDVYVNHADGIDIYLCKFIMGAMNSSRWSQIKESFTKAMEPKGVKVFRWILCMPKKIHRRDAATWNRFMKDRSSYDVEIKYIDGNEIIYRMGKVDRENGTNLLPRLFKVLDNGGVTKCPTNSNPESSENVLINQIDNMQDLRSTLDVSQFQSHYYRKETDLHNSNLELSALCEKRNHIKHTSLWIPDAEYVRDEQSEFKNLTYTNYCRDFLKVDTSIWGIISTKGVGKTYLLQIKRRVLNDYAIPKIHKLSEQNGWGLESVRVDCLENVFNTDIDELVKLWKVSIICFVIICINKSDDVIAYDSLSKHHLPDNILFIFNNPFSFNHLSDIFNYIILEKYWDSYIALSYVILKDICNSILYKQKIGNQDKDIRIMLFIDKISQSIIQPGLEVPSCADCSMKNNIIECEYAELPMSEREAHCQNCSGCCKTCELFSNPLVGNGLRVYKAKHLKNQERLYLWNSLQLAIVKAVYDIKFEYNSAIQVYYAIRQEAFIPEFSDLGANFAKIAEHTRMLHYTKKEQEDIFYNTIKIQPSELLYDKKLVDKGLYAEGFVGILELSHPYVDGAKETLFEIIYRHSFDRAREIQVFGDELSKLTPELRNSDNIRWREEAVSRTIEKTAADLVFSKGDFQQHILSSYYSDKRFLLNSYWANPQNFEAFILEIDRNLLFIDDIALICRKINDNIECDCKCNGKKCILHPFTMLYQIGLLGFASYYSYYENDCEQQFLDSHNITYYSNEEQINLNDNTIYIIHPALAKCIENNMRKAPIHHFKGFILGKGLTIPRRIHHKLMLDKKNMKKDEFLYKYYS